MNTDSSVVLAFDVRKPLVRERQAIATIDVNIWEQPASFTYDEILNNASKLMNRDKGGLYNPLNLSFMTCIPNEWMKNGLGKEVLLVAFSSKETGPSREAFRGDLLNDEYFGCRVTYVNLVKSGWISAGFDICDDTLSTSLLYTSRDISLISVLSRNKQLELLNKYGLFCSEDVAEKYSKHYGKIIGDHGAFSAVEVLMKTVVE